MQLKRIFILRALTLAALTVLILAALQWPQHFGFLYFEGPPHLADAEMIVNFREHRAEYELLRKMMAEDKGLAGVDHDRTWPEDVSSINIPSSRIRKYRKLLEDLDLSSGVSANIDRTTIEFTASYRGWATHGSWKGYVYTDEPVAPKDIMKDLDYFEECTANSGMRRIAGNWYLYYSGY